MSKPNCTGSHKAQKPPKPENKKSNRSKFHAMTRQN